MRTINYGKRANAVISRSVLAVGWMKWLCQFFYYVLCKVFVYFIMPWDRLFLASFLISIQIVTDTVPYECTSGR